MPKKENGKRKLVHNMDERAWNQREKIVESILKDMEENEGNWVKGWGIASESAKASMLPRNGVSGHIYQGSNRFNLYLIAMIEGYDDPRWMTFNQARKNGWSVKKGEKCAYVEHWRPVTGAVKQVDDETGEETLIARTYMVCDGVKAVFNANQIDGVPALELDEDMAPIDDLDGILSIADSMIDSSRCKVRESVIDMSAYYSPGRDFINIPTRQCFNSPNEFAATLAHEMAHSTGHESALGRNIENAFGSDDYAFEELVAELSSMFTMAELGIENLGYSKESDHYKNHLAYLKSWNDKLKEKPELFFRAGKLAMDATGYVVARIDKVGDLDSVQEQEESPSARYADAKAIADSIGNDGSAQKRKGLVV